MLASAPRRHPIIKVLGPILLFSACSKQAEPPPKPDDKPAVAVAVAPADAADAVAPVTPQPRRAARTGLARRCVLGGDPLPADCVGGGEGIAFGKDGMLYVVAGKTVRRYQRADGDCQFEPSGEPIAMPPDNTRPQSIDGPVYMRSGGAAWHLLRAGDAVYAHDFLGGLFRIDRGKVEPACEDVFGYGSVAALGKRLLVARKGIEELKLGKKCKAVSAKLDDKGRGELYAIRDVLYRASGSELVRYAGATPAKLGPATPAKLGEGTRICYVTGMAACGDGACVLDSNCMQMIQLGADGKVLRVLDDDKLFATRPWSVAELAASDGGDVYVLARHRDKQGDKEICEAAIYEVPAAAFAL